jgi:hypothetical protein
MSMEATLATWELTKKQVNPREKFLLLSLARRAGEDHTCWPSIKRMVEDTGFDRKTVVEVRQSLIDKKLLKYTGRMVGRSAQIPEMQLLYVEQWEQKRNSPRLNDEDEPVDNLSTKSVTSPKNGTGTSPKNGTGTSTENGTLNSKYENKRRNKKSFCETARKKTKAEWRKENSKTHAFAEKMDNVEMNKKQMQREAEHIAQNEVFKKAQMPEEFRERLKQLKCIGLH